MTLVESTYRATPPWNSIDAGRPIVDALAQQYVDTCLMCPHGAECCDYCKGDANPRKGGRPKKEVDIDLLRELVALQKRTAEICAALGVSERTVRNLKKSYC